MDGAGSVKFRYVVDRFRLNVDYVDLCGNSCTFYFAGKYTSLCDVWSYGVLIWEIFSKGDNPYPGMSNTEARNKIDLGKNRKVDCRVMEFAV